MQMFVCESGQRTVQARVLDAGGWRAGASPDTPCTNWSIWSCRDGAAGRSAASGIGRLRDMARHGAATRGAKPATEAAADHVSPDAAGNAASTPALLPHESQFTVRSLTRLGTSIAFSSWMGDLRQIPLLLLPPSPTNHSFDPMSVPAASLKDSLTDVRGRARGRTLAGQPQQPESRPGVPQGRRLAQQGSRRGAAGCCSPPVSLPRPVQLEPEAACSQRSPPTKAAEQ